MEIWKKGKLNSEMIWKIWKISVLVIMTPTFFVFIELFNGYLFVYLSVCFMFSLFFSVSNFYFTSQYHQFPLSHPAAAAAIYPRVAAATTTTTSTHFPYLFIIQLTFSLYFPSLFTFQLTFLS